MSEPIEALAIAHWCGHCGEFREIYDIPSGNLYRKETDHPGLCVPCLKEWYAAVADQNPPLLSPSGIPLTNPPEV